ncbi:MAG TPA: amino acid racemase [Terriglobales bacterium]|nr:amino acid racemase [Terriglobales bacterium]
MARNIQVAVLFVFCAALAVAPQNGGKTQSSDLPAPSEMKPVGLIGGTAWYSTVDYYRYINKAVNDAYGNNTNPPLIIYNLDNHRIQQLQDQNRWDDIAAILVDAAMKLHSSGAKAILLCANTQHKAYSQVAPQIHIPILHIGDATGTAVKAAGLKKVGLIGTKFTMEDPFMISWLKDHYGIEAIVPASASARRELHRIIHDELDIGVYKPESKKYVLDQIQELQHRGAQGIVLGCTEFPLIVKQSDVSIPLFDTTVLHSQMAVDFILGKHGLAHVQATQ